jgi:polysaccharide biosynthesis/export protein
LKAPGSSRSITAEEIDIRRLILVAALALAASGCAKTKPLDPALVTAATVSEGLPAPGPGDSAGPVREYRIGALDKVRVQVFGVQELDREGQVDVDGNFSMPLIGAVRAVGSTSNELAAKLEQLYGERYLRNPQISVAILEAVSQQVTVDGAVEKSGQYPVIGNTTLMTTIASAGGLSDLAKPDDILVFRTINDKRMVARFSLAAIRSGAAIDPAIYGNDVVVVGEGAGRLSLRDILLLTPVLGAFYQFTR